MQTAEGAKPYQSRKPFDHPTIHEHDRIVEESRLKKEYPSLYNLKNKPRGFRDHLLLKLSGALRGLPLPKIAGSPALKADFCEPYFKAQMKKGKLSPEQATRYTQSINDGGGRWFFYDMIVGASTHHLWEKLAAPKVHEIAHQISSSDTIANGVTLYYLGSNFLGLLAFIPRGFIEYRHYKSELKKQEIEPEDKRKLLKKAKTGLAQAVLSNAFPLASALSTPLMNQYRYEFCKPILDYYLDPVKERITKIRGKLTYK